MNLSSGCASRLQDSQWAVSEHMCKCACVFSVLAVYVFMFILHRSSSTCSTVLSSPVCAWETPGFCVSSSPDESWLYCTFASFLMHGCVGGASSLFCTPSPDPTDFRPGWRSVEEESWQSSVCCGTQNSGHQRC